MRYTIRKVTKADLPKYKVGLYSKAKIIDVGKELTDVEEWNRGIDIFEMLLDKSPNGNYCLELDNPNKEVVSFCGGFEMDNDSIQIHSYITQEKYR